MGGGRLQILTLGFPDEVEVPVPWWALPATSVPLVLVGSTHSPTQVLPNPGYPDSRWTAKPGGCWPQSSLEECKEASGRLTLPLLATSCLQR